jgi:hypothetical protein
MLMDLPVVGERLVAGHIGPVDHDGNGFIGSDINLLFRMPEARPLRRALNGSSTWLAFNISKYVGCRKETCHEPQTSMIVVARL